MALKTVTLSLPEHLLLRLQQVAQATRQSLEAVLLRTIQVGIPPTWEDIPAEFQPDVAALDRLDDTALWQVARQKPSQNNVATYEHLLAKQSTNPLSATEQTQLNQLRTQADRLMLCKAQAVALLKWRGHTIPPANQL